LILVVCGVGVFKADEIELKMLGCAGQGNFPGIRPVQQVDGFIVDPHAFQPQARKIRVFPACLGNEADQSLAAPEIEPAVTAHAARAYVELAGPHAVIAGKGAYRAGPRIDPGQEGIRGSPYFAVGPGSHAVNDRIAFVRTQRKMREAVRAGFEHVRLHLRTHPDTAAGIRMQAYDEIIGKRPWYGRIVDEMGKVAVLLHAVKPAARTDPERSGGIDGQGENIAGGKRFWPVLVMKVAGHRPGFGIVTDQTAAAQASQPQISQLVFHDRRDAVIAEQSVGTDQGNAVSPEFTGFRVEEVESARFRTDPNPILAVDGDCPDHVAAQAGGIVGAVAIIAIAARTRVMHVQPVAKGSYV